MTNETDEQDIAVPETFHKMTGAKGNFRGWEDQAWNDFLSVLNDEEYPHYIYGYFPVYILWDLDSTTRYGSNIYNDATIDTGQIYGKQASGVLIISDGEIVLQARKHISQKFPAYPPILSGGGLMNIVLSGLAQKKVIALTIYPQDFGLQIPLDELSVGVQSHVSLRNAVAVQHPEVGSLRVESLFTGDNAEIVKMIRAVQRKVQRQTQQNLMQAVANQVISEEMQQELAAIASLRELNEEAYEAAVQAIVKKYGGV